MPSPHDMQPGRARRLPSVPSAPTTLASETVTVPERITASALKHIVGRCYREFSRQAEAGSLKQTIANFCHTCGQEQVTELCFASRKLNVRIYIRDEATPSCNHLSLNTGKMPDELRVAAVPMASDADIDIVTLAAEGIAKRLHEMLATAHDQAN